jgi:predicted nucleotidyltransferase
MAMRIMIAPGTLEKFCKNSGIRWMALFGSAVRGELKPDSDIDVLVEFNEPVGLFEIVRIEDKLSQFFGGRKVDLVVKQGLDEFIRDQVLSGCEVIYGKAG